MTTQTIVAEPYIITDKRGCAIVNGGGVKVRDIIDSLLTYRSLDDVASHLQIRVEYIEAAIAYTAAQIK